MQQFFTRLIFCCMVVISAGVCAQNPKVDAEVAKYTGQTIVDYLHLPDFRVLPDSNARKYCTDESCYYYTGNHVVFGRTFYGDPAAVNELPKAKYRQLIDRYNALLIAVGDPGNQERDSDERTIFTWQGVHTTITAIDDTASKLISLTFTDNYLVPK